MKRSELKQIIRDLVEEGKKGDTTYKSPVTVGKYTITGWKLDANGNSVICYTTIKNGKEIKKSTQLGGVIPSFSKSEYTDIEKGPSKKVINTFKKELDIVEESHINDQTYVVKESFVVDSKKELDVFEEGIVTSLAKAAGTAISKVVSAARGVGALLKKGMENAKTFKQTAVKRYDQVQKQTATKGKAATWISQMLKPTIKEAALTITDLNKLVYDPKKVAAALADEESGVAASYIIANFVTATTQMAESIQALKGLLTEANETVAPEAAPAATGAPAAPAAAPGATPTTQPGVQQAGRNYGTRKMAEESKSSRFFKYGNK